MNLFRMNFLVGCLLIGLVSSGSVAEEIEAITNADVLQLLSVQLSDEVILSRIETARTDFDLGAGSLVALKEAGASDAIVAAMIQSMEAGTLDRSPSVEEPRYDGVFYLLGEDGSLLELERSKASLEARAKMMGFRGGEQSLAIPGETSSVVLPSGVRNPSIIVRVPGGRDPHSAVQFTSLTVVSKKKRGKRLAPLAAYKSFGRGVAAGSEEGAVVFEAEAYGESSIRLTPVAPLSEGEYGLYVVPEALTLSLDLFSFRSE